MELVKENIECEQLLGENSSDTIVRAEYVIPDTHPDVQEILMIDAKPSIINKEVMQDKVYIEGQVEYNVLYLAMEDEKLGVHSVTYTGKFSNYVEINGVGHKMRCDTDCLVEHMECNIANERKINVEGIIKLKAEAYKNYNFEVVKGIDSVESIQMLKNPTTVDKIVGNVSGELVAKSHIHIPMEKPQIGTILKCDLGINKKDVKLFDGKIQVSAFIKVMLLYRGKNTTDVQYVEDEVLVNKDMEAENINSNMESHTDFKVDGMNYDVKEDDLGENRIIDIEALIKTSTKIMFRQEMDMIEDAYSPVMAMQMDKKEYDLNVMHGHKSVESIVKGNIELAPDMPKPSQVIMSNGKASITDKKVLEDKVIIEGVLKVDVLYKTNDETRQIATASDEIPFTTAIDLMGTRIDMQSIAKVNMENIDSDIEANTIGVKAVIEVYVRVNYLVSKDFLVGLTPIEDEKPMKKSSITIYVVQAGDTMWKIAKNYFTTVDALVSVNDMEDPDMIKPGQKLIIPGRALI